MRWLSHRTPQATPRGRHAAGASTTPRTFIPAEAIPAGVIPAAATPVDVVAVPAPGAGVASEPPPVPEPDLERSGVHLGFADGSEHELTPGDPRVGAFRAVAVTLAGA